MQKTLEDDSGLQGQGQLSMIRTLEEPYDTPKIHFAAIGVTKALLTHWFCTQHGIIINLSSQHKFCGILPIREALYSQGPEPYTLHSKP